MRMSTRKRTVVSVPYIAQGKMGTPNNFACVGGGEGEGLGPTACRYDVNSRECKTDLGGLQYGPIVHFIYSPPVVMQNEGLATGVCVVCVCVCVCPHVLCVCPHVLCVCPHALCVCPHPHVHCKRVNGVRVQIKLGCVSVMEGACPDKGGRVYQHSTCSSDPSSL